MIIYKVQITYPNGNIEEIDEDFYTLAKAQEYGEHMLGQVSYNADFHAPSFDLDGNEENVEPFFLVLAREGEEEKIAFDSRQ